MPKIAGKKSEKQRADRQKRKKQIIYGLLIVIGVFFAAAALRIIISDFAEDAAARSEYERLKEFSPNISTQEQLPNNTPGDDIDTGQNDNIGNNNNPEDNEDPGNNTGAEEEEEGVNIFALSFEELASLNRDFIGWIIAGNTIDYPVVRGNDNDKYINTTFTGNRNTAGAIFMDYRHTRGFDEQVSIVYGHNTRDRTMFSSLINYLDPEYMRKHPNIYITTRDGKSLIYKVFAAKITDAWDPSYTIGVLDRASAPEVFINAPEDATRFLLLSTCTRGPDDDERILVYASLV